MDGAARALPLANKGYTLRCPGFTMGETGQPGAEGKVNWTLDKVPGNGINRILQVMQSLAGPYQLSNMLEEIFQAGLEVTGSELCTLWLYDTAEDNLKMHFPAVYPPIVIDKGKGIAWHCLEDNQTIALDDPYADPRFIPEIDERTGRNTRNLLSVPLVGHESSKVGVLQFLNKQPGSFGAADELLATVLAAQCAVALQRTSMIESLLSKERLDEEVAIAREIQLSTLPEPPCCPDSLTRVQPLIKSSCKNK